MKKVVCLGGGGAMPKAVLPQIKNEDIDLKVISATLDSGGSSGKLRKDYNIIAVGDLRRAFLELSSLDNKAVLDYRFKDGHNLANLIIASILLNEENPIDVLNNFFKTIHRVLPITLETANLCAELQDGGVVVGETNIDIPKHDSKIKRVFLDKDILIYPEAYEKIIEADAIIIGPGDLYSSLIQVLLIAKEAINKSKAKLIYICNPINKKGETDNFTVLDFEREIEKYLNKKLDHVIFNNDNNIFSKFDLVSFSLYNDSKHIGLSLLKENELAYDPKKLVNQIMKLI
ncbi:MAG: YvcK family protein [Candidatus Pacebacteria bacterium]|nr:YvcK family protein [Candidatus Paceibacterota bacterium]